MSFRDNLQHLRATHAMTQEQLALMLGVSRQSVTKWEAEKSYPEMDKLLKLCQIFDVTLDDLVQGDLTTSAPTPAVQARAAILREAAGGPPQDVCGYDEHMRTFAWKIAWGVFAILAGVALLMAWGGWAEASAPSSTRSSSAAIPSSRTSTRWRTVSAPSDSSRGCLLRASCSSSRALWLLL